MTAGLVNPWTAAGAIDSTAVAITGGTITGTNAPYVLSQAGIPFISLSSGSVSAAGAISAITALPFAYASAYCYFPANILATVKAAGWYYCTFSTTTAGTAFLDAYTSGTPTIPSSPTAVTDGKGAFTGDTGAETGLSISVPAGAMGANGSARITTHWAFNNTANAKTYAVKFGTTTAAGPNGASTTSAKLITDVFNRGLAASQTMLSSGVAGAATAVGNGSEIVATENTAVATNITTVHTRATATDNLILAGYRIEVMYAA